MATNIIHSLQHRNRLLILALIISLLVHALFVLFYPKPPEEIQSSSKARMSIVMNWSQSKVSESMPVKSEQKLSASKSFENIQEVNKNIKPDKHVIQSTNTLQEQKALVGLTKPDLKLEKTLVKKVDRLVEKPVKPQDNMVTQNPKQEALDVILPNAESEVFKEATQTNQLTSQSEKKPQTSPDIQDDIQISRFQIGSNDNPKPKYPSLAARRGWQGEVVLGVHVRADGSIEHLSFVKSTNYGVLNFEAYETVRTSWHFKALEGEDQQSETAYIEVPITFNIANR